MPPLNLNICFSQYVSEWVSSRCVQQIVDTSYLMTNNHREMPARKDLSINGLPPPPPQKKKAKNTSLVVTICVLGYVPPWRAQLKQTWFPNLVRMVCWEEMHAGHTLLIPYIPWYTDESGYIIYCSRWTLCLYIFFSPWWMNLVRLLPQSIATSTIDVDVFTFPDPLS